MPASSRPPCPASSRIVDDDLAELATHMAYCGRARGALFELRRHLQEGSSILSGHIVTVAFIGISLVALASMLA